MLRKIPKLTPMVRLQTAPTGGAANVHLFFGFTIKFR